MKQYSCVIQIQPIKQIWLIKNYKSNSHLYDDRLFALNSVVNGCIKLKLLP